MTDFEQYKRKVSHIFGDVSSVSGAQHSLIEGLVGAMGETESATLARENVINKVRYQNLAIESSARAYAQSPNDLEAYKFIYRKQLEGYPIPLAQRHEYEALALSTESRYYSPILVNKEVATRSVENDELLTLADTLCKDGIFVLGGNVPHHDENYVGDRLTEALEVLSIKDGEGFPIFGVEEISDRVDRYLLDTLTTLVGKDIDNLTDPIVGASEYVNGKDYIAEINSSRGKIKLSSSSLSESATSQFRKNIESAIIKNLKSKSAREAFANGKHLMNYPATYRGTAAQRNGLDEWARVQLDAQPLSADNENLHIDNMIKFAHQFSYIPSPYVEILSANINGRGNPLVALSSSKLLNLAIERGGGGISKQFDDVTLLKSQLLVDLIWNANIDPQRALDSVCSIFHDARSRDYTITLNEKLKILRQRDHKQFYGTDVEEQIYGPDGVAMYEDLVRDLFLINGGDAKSARKVARSRIDEIYSYPEHGYFKKHGWVFKTGGRKLKYQPEAYYGQGIGKMIDKEMSESVIPMIREKLRFSDISEKNYFLVATPLTVDAFHAPSKWKLPKWEVWYVNESGSRIRVTNENGDSLVYSTDKFPEENKVLKRIAERHAARVAAEHEWMRMTDDEKRESAEKKELYWGTSEWAQNF